MRGKLVRRRKKMPEAEPPPAPLERARNRSVFTGDLGQFGLVDIAQTMMSGRKTGLLTVRSGSRVGYIYFREGQVVYVMDDRFSQGLQAALQVFLWREGTFEFDFEKDTPGENITLSTENLLFEVARQLDEVQRTDKGVVRSKRSTARSLQDRHMEQIREAFAEIAQKVMPEIRGGGRIAPRGSSVETWLKRLTPKTGDSIFLIPGLKPKLKKGNAVTNLDGPRVDPQSIERFVRAALDRQQQETLRRERSVEVLVEVGQAAPARLQISGEGSQKMVVAHLLHKVPDLFANLDEEPAFLEEVEGLDRGLVLIAGGPSTGKSRLLASLIRRRAETRGSLVFLLSRSRESIFENTTGLVLQRQQPKGSAEFAETLRICLTQSPDLIALDGLSGPGVMEAAIRAASTGVGIAGCVEADSAQEALQQATDFMERKKDTVSRKLFRDHFRSILFLERTAPSDDESLGVRVHHYRRCESGAEKVIDQGIPGTSFGLLSSHDL